MRSVSAALNRVLLAFFGLLIICASAWFLASGLDAGHHLPGLSRVPCHGAGPIRSDSFTSRPLARAVRRSGISAYLRHRSVPAPHAGAAQACEFSAQAQRLRWHSAGYSLPPMSCRKPSPSAFRTCPVSSAAPFSSPAPPSKLWVQAETSVAPDCEVEWTVTEIRKLLNEDVATSLGAPPKQLDVLVRLARSVSSTSTSKAVTGQPSPAITGTDTGA